MGGAQSLALVSMYPELVRKVILEDPAVWPMTADEAYIAERRDPWIAGLRQWLTMSHAELVAFKRNEAPHWSDEALGSLDGQLHNDPIVPIWLNSGKILLWDWLKPVDVPILVLYCEAEKGGVVPAAFAEALVNYMPNLTAQIIPGVGDEMHHDNPAAFMVAVLAFMTVNKSRVGYPRCAECTVGIF
jgi:pimeloyl-ACP methyl ester carboxylesterase